jgi:hypothetical protein
VSFVSDVASLPAAPRPLDPHAALYRAVIAKAADDADGAGSLPVKVRQWLDTPDFEQCCYLADLDSESVREALVGILSERLVGRTL